MKTLIYIVLALGFLSSCDQRKERYSDMLPAPTLEILGSNGSPIDKDSLKLTLKSGKKTSSFILSIDGDNQKKKVLVQVVNGSGSLTVDGKTGQELELSNGRHSVTYSPSSVNGNTLISFTLTDEQGKMSSDKMEVITFGNISPNAALEVKPNKIYSNLQYILDASKSVDGDGAMGGYIVKYEFTINDKKITSNEPAIDWVFGAPGIYSLSVTAIDNDGGKTTFNLGPTDIN